MTSIKTTEMGYITDIYHEHYEGPKEQTNWFKIFEFAVCSLCVAERDQPTRKLLISYKM